MYKWFSAENPSPLLQSHPVLLKSLPASGPRPAAHITFYSTKNRARRPSAKAPSKRSGSNRLPPHGCRSASSSTSVTRVTAAALRKLDTNSHRPAYRVVVSKHAVDERINRVQLDDGYQAHPAQTRVRGYRGLCVFLYLFVCVCVAFILLLLHLERLPHVCRVLGSGGEFVLCRNKEPRKKQRKKVMRSLHINLPT